MNVITLGKVVPYKCCLPSLNISVKKDFDKRSFKLTLTMFMDTNNWNKSLIRIKMLHENTSFGDDDLIWPIRKMFLFQMRRVVNANRYSDCCSCAHLFRSWMVG